MTTKNFNVFWVTWVSYNFLWGLWLIVFHPFDTSLIYSTLDAIANSSLWGLALVLFTFGALASERLRSLKYFNIFQGLTTAFWLSVLVSLAVSNLHLTSTPVYLFMSVVSVQVWLYESSEMLNEL